MVSPINFRDIFIKRLSLKRTKSVTTLSNKSTKSNDKLSINNEKRSQTKLQRRKSIAGTSSFMYQYKETQGKQLRRASLFFNDVTETTTDEKGVKTTSFCYTAL